MPRPRTFRTLREENERLREELRFLRGEERRYREENRGLRAEAERLRKRVEGLEQKLANATRQAAPFRKAKKKRDETGPRRKPGRRRGHAASYRKPAADVEEGPTIEVPLCACPHCGGTEFSDARTVEQTVEDIPEPRVVRTTYRVETAQCAACGKRVRGRHPGQVSEASGSAGTQVGPRAAALATELKHRFGASYRKTAALLRDAFGFSVTPGALYGIGLRMARRFEPTLEALTRDLRRSATVHADETGWPLCGKNGWLWVFAAVDTCIYKIRPTRKADVVCETLGIEKKKKSGRGRRGDGEASGTASASTDPEETPADRAFQGILVTDGYVAYDSLDIPDNRRQQCLGHILHRAAEMRDTLIGMALRFPLAVMELLRNAMGTKDSKPILAGNPSDAGRPSQYDDYVAGLEKQLDKLLARPPTQPDNKRLAKHLKKHRNQLLTFLYHDDVDATNNFGERSIRIAVMLRKTTGGNRTLIGAWIHEVLASVSATCRLRGHSYLAAAQSAYCGHPTEIPRKDQ